MLRNIFMLAMVVGLSQCVVCADVAVNSLFTSGAVLQQGVVVPVWGTAADGEKVTVKLCGQSRSTVARDGKWMVRLQPLKAGGPFTLSVYGKNKLDIPNILVGEVWICSGQSNMEFPLSMAKDSTSTLANCADSLIRLYRVPHNYQDNPIDDANAKWMECDSNSAAGFSAIAYFFGRDMRKALNVPIGLIDASYGGTILQAWTNTTALMADEQSRGFLKDVPDWATKQNKFGSLYNGMIHPIIPYAIRGALWYQGESNIGGGYTYFNIHKIMIQNWREEWGLGDFPFLFVQIAPFAYSPVTSEIKDSPCAQLRQAQFDISRKCPNTAMVVTLDVGDEKDIHPKDKETVGKRLALAARAVAYKERILYSGPAYKSMYIKEDRIILDFDNIGSGLAAKGGELTGFIIAGKDHKFVNARASIQGDKVVVSSDEVSEPVAVRYAWSECPVANLFSKDGLPAPPFRTDNF